MENKNTYNTEKVVAEYSRYSYLLKPEQAILDRIKLLNPAKMLDIGVGAGRTTKYFAPFFKEYHGMDYSEKMIQECVKKFQNNENISFSVGDARNLENFGKNSFDFILFSFNGIDCVSIEDRRKVLNEIFNTGKNGSYFTFSFHNMYNLPKLFSYQIPKNPLKWVKEYKRVKGVRKNNHDINELLKMEAAEIIDGDLDFSTSYVYIKPESQLKQLSETGFKTISIYRLSDGAEISPDTSWSDISDAWLYIFCRIEK